MHILVTGSSGLIGSEAVEFFDRLEFRVTGADNHDVIDVFMHLIAGGHRLQAPKNSLSTAMAAMPPTTKIAKVMASRVASFVPSAWI